MLGPYVQLVTDAGLTCRKNLKPITSPACRQLVSLHSVRLDVMVYCFGIKIN